MSRYLTVSPRYQSPHRFLETNQVGVIDDVTRSRIVSAEIPTTDGPLRMAVKTYHARGLTCATKDLFRSSRAVREFLFAGKLFEAGLPVPEPLAALEHRLRLVKRLGCRGALVSPLIVGPDTVNWIAEESGLALLAHPALSGSYFAAQGDDGQVFGFVCFGKSAQIPTIQISPYDMPALYIGLALAPSLCGRGQGSVFLKDCLAFAADRFPAQPLEVVNDLWIGEPV